MGASRRLRVTASHLDNLDNLRATPAASAAPGAAKVDEMFAM